jgi:cytochrome c biogenesis protein CcdA
MNDKSASIFSISFSLLLIIAMIVETLMGDNVRIFHIVLSIILMIVGIIYGIRYKRGKKS